MLLSSKNSSILFLNHFYLMWWYILLNKEQHPTQWNQSKQLTTLTQTIPNQRKMFYWLWCSSIKSVMLFILELWEFMGMEQLKIYKFLKDIVWQSSIALMLKNVNASLFKSCILITLVAFIIWQNVWITLHCWTFKNSSTYPLLSSIKVLSGEFKHLKLQSTLIWLIELMLTLIMGQF